MQEYGSVKKRIPAYFMQCILLTCWNTAFNSFKTPKVCRETNFCLVNTFVHSVHIGKYTVFKLRLKCTITELRSVQFPLLTTLIYFLPASFPFTHINRASNALSNTQKWSTLVFSRYLGQNVCLWCIIFREKQN